MQNFLSLWGDTFKHIFCIVKSVFVHMLRVCCHCLIGDCFHVFLSLQDEYFEVNNLRTKHDGYFVNKGKLEQM